MIDAGCELGLAVDTDWILDPVGELLAPSDTGGGAG